MKISFLFSILLISNHLLTVKSAPNIRSDIHVRLSERIDNTRIVDTEKDDDSNGYDFFYIYPVTVEQIIYLSDFYASELELNIEHTPMFYKELSTLYYNEISVTEKNGYSIQQVPFQFTGDTLSIQLPSPNCEINIQYRFQSDYFMRHQMETCIYLQPQIYSWHSWYFRHPDMNIDLVDFVVADKEACFFATATTQKTDSLFVVDISKIKNNDISFYIFDSQFYDKIVVNEQSVTTNLFMTKGARIDTLEYTEQKQIYQINPRARDSMQNILNNSETIRKTLQKIISFFNVQDSVKLNIADAYLQFEDDAGKKYVWGNATHCSDKETFLLIDTSAWQENGVIHEMLHSFSRYAPADDDSSYYFLNESLIEYLAVCFGYDKQQRDSVFNSKIDKYRENVVNNQFVSIFKTTTNKVHGGSSNVIYMRTPYRIHLLAKSIGEDIFLSILRNFYLNVQKQKRCSFADFEQIVKQSGISTKQWNVFLEDL